jgi:beta-galactosidase
LAIKLDKKALQKGKNSIAVVALPFQERKRNGGEMRSAGIQILTPAEPWKRKVFNGLAQVIVQSTGKSGEVILTATSQGLTQSVIKLKFGE